mgnify:CR=1 FL=1
MRPRYACGKGIGCSQQGCVLKLLGVRLHVQTQLPFWLWACWCAIALVEWWVVSANLFPRHPRRKWCPSEAASPAALTRGAQSGAHTHGALPHNFRIPELKPTPHTRSCQLLISIPRGACRGGCLVCLCLLTRSILCADYACLGVYGGLVCLYSEGRRPTQPAM